MRRRTLDVVFSVGGLLLAGLLLVLGVILQNQSDFAKEYVHDQLAEQRITFTPIAQLRPQERRAQCLRDFAGAPLTTGKQAECYANEYIGLHVTEVNDGRTYAQTSSDARSAKTAAEASAQSGSADAVSLAARAQALDAKTQTLFRGETLRGLLLTSYGFSIFGERAHQAAVVCFLVAGVLLLAGIAGLVHAAGTPRDETVPL